MGEDKQEDPTVKVLFEVLEERHRQDVKWGVQHHSIYKWLAILSEEVGEAAEAMLDAERTGRADDIAHLREELVQTAAVAVEMVEALDRQGFRAI